MIGFEAVLAVMMELSGKSLFAGTCQGVLIDLHDKVLGWDLGLGTGTGGGLGLTRRWGGAGVLTGRWGDG